MLGHPRASLLASFLPLVLLASACAPKSASELGETIVVRGAVTDLSTGQPIADVKVTLVSDASFPSQTTNAGGLFVFDDVQRLDNLLVQFQKDGYFTKTITVNIGATTLADGGTHIFLDGFDASVALSQALLIPVAGTVYTGASPAKGAQVSLWDDNGNQGYSTKAGDDGTFSFPGVLAGVWNLVVLPLDRDGDGFSDTQFFSVTLDVTPGGAPNLGNVVVNLLDVQRALVASSFVGLNRPYPISPGTLLTGVTGILQAVGGSLFLHFGAEVDDTLTSFELVPIEAGGRAGLPIGLTVAWAHKSVVSLTPASALVASTDTNVGYELRIRALRFADGTVGIPASGTAWGKIDFAVQQLPVALANPTPILSVANKLTATQTAVSAVVDDSTVWLLDANGDFVYDTVPAANYSSTNPLQLQWPAVAGAVNYHVWARNTVSLGNNQQGNLDWRELPATFLTPIDASQNVPVIATVNPWASMGVDPNLKAPWRFGNNVLFAVTCEDALAFRSEIDTTKVLTTKDGFGGLLTGITVDPTGQPAPFAPVTERGGAFARTFKLSFSEPMNAAVPPTLTSTGGALTIKKTIATGFGNAAPDASVGNAANAFVSVLLQSTTPCTELMLARAAGDTLLPVRDASLFPVSATDKALFLDGATGAFLGESVGIAASDTTANLVTLTVPLVPALTVNALVCNISAPGVATFVSTAATSVVVSDAKAFSVGQTVMIYEPQVSGAGQIPELHTLAGIDTPTNTLVLNSAPTAGHTTASLVFPLTAGGETALRSSTLLTLAKDIAGGNDVDLFLSGPVNGVTIGDLILLDADGDLKTTTDQVQVKVKQVKFAPAAPPIVYSVVVDIPAAITLLHGRSIARALGDSFSVAGTRDTSAAAPKALDLHRDQFTPDAVLF